MALVKTWTTPTEIGATDPMSATLFNQALMQNMMYLNGRPYSQYLSDGDADWVTTSAVPVSIDSDVMRLELDTVTGNVEVWGNIILANDNDGQYSYLGVEIDDDYMHGDVPSGVKTPYIWVDQAAWNGNEISANFCIKIFGLSVGTHSFNPMIWRGGGNLTWKGGLMNEFGVREI